MTNSFIHTPIVFDQYVIFKSLLSLPHFGQLIQNGGERGRNIADAHYRASLFLRIIGDDLIDLKLW